MLPPGQLQWSLAQAGSALSLVKPLEKSQTLSWAGGPEPRPGTDLGQLPCLLTPAPVRASCMDPSAGLSRVGCPWGGLTGACSLSGRRGGLVPMGGVDGVLCHLWARHPAEGAVLRRDQQHLPGAVHPDAGVQPGQVRPPQ